jgi:23S rRNA pseudouridine1911/1915/1917 synthase
MQHIALSDLPLLEALSTFFPQSSKTTLRSWIKDGRVEVDGQQIKTVNASTLVLKGQTISVGQRRKFIPHHIEILHEDEDFVVIDKPSGLLSVSTAFETTETAFAVLKNYYRNRKVYVVHRLDQDTSGVMLFAFNPETCESLKKIFAAHAIERAYIGIIEGQLPSPKGIWKSRLYEDGNYVVRVTADENEGEEAITHYETIATSKRYSWLNLTLETGKKNQIRVHCQVTGHPIVGDKKYGAESNPVRRLCLHARLLAFNHPLTHKKLSFESPAPQEFYRLVKPADQN